VTSNSFDTNGVYHKNPYRSGYPSDLPSQTERSLTQREYTSEKADIIAQYIKETTDKGQQINILQKKLNEVSKNLNLCEERLVIQCGETEKLRTEVSKRDRTIHNLKLAEEQVASLSQSSEN
jgi:predicted oxidoreductase